jgi:hypothetical protein
MYLGCTRIYLVCTCTYYYGFQYAMTWSVSTLMLTVLVIMASRASAPANGPAQELRCRVTRFVCAKCTETGQPSSRGLFLSQAAVWQHLAASKPCFTAKLGFLEIQVNVLTSDVMAGAGGAAGPAPDVRHQPEGNKFHTQCIDTLHDLYSSPR